MWKKTELLKRISVCFMGLLVLITATACSDNNKKTVRYNAGMEVSSLSNGATVSNDRFDLVWDNNLKGLFLHEKATGTFWSTIPYDYYEQNYSDPESILASPLNIGYVEPDNNQLRTLNGYSSAVQNGRVSCASIKNGFEVVYYFDEVEIAVPMRFLLRDSGLEVRILLDKVYENENLLYSISLMPNFMSVINCADTEKENNYIFVPSGSGALMYADGGVRKVRNYSEPVYGKDPSKYASEQLENTNTVRLPVFGVKADEKALLCILQEGAESAVIEAQTGNENIGYSQVYPVFQVRGVDDIQIPDVSGASKSSTRYSKDRLKKEYLSVFYQPLSGEQASYSGMAQAYTDYLIETSGLTKRASAESPLHIEFLGGALQKKLFCGIPYNSLESVTDFTEVQEILEELVSKTGIEPVVKLTGYGESGLDISRIGGGFTFGDAMGGVKGYRQLKKYCDDTSIPLFADFDLVHYRKNGFGLKTREAALNSNSVVARQYRYSVATLAIDHTTYDFVNLKREKLSSVVDVLLEKAQKNDIGGISLTSLGNTVYSDYSSQKTFVKSGMAADVSASMQKIRKSGHTLLTEDANVYAAALSDYLFGTPTSSSGYDGLDTEVPFYQMVFKGYVPVSVSSVNLSPLTQKQFLKAIESGSALSFTLTAEYNPDLMLTPYSALLTSTYEDQKQMIFDMADASSDYYNEIQGATIINHRFLNAEVTETVFSNGVTALVNFSKKSYQTSSGITVSPENYTWYKE